MNDTQPLTESQQQACEDFLEFLTSLEDAECDRCDYCNTPLVTLSFTPMPNVQKTYRKCLNCGSNIIGSQE